MNSKFVRTVTIGSLLLILRLYELNNAMLSPGESLELICNSCSLFTLCPLELGDNCVVCMNNSWQSSRKVQKRYDYTASRRAGTMHCCIAVSFNMLPSQRVSFNVLPTQRVYPWDCISNRFVLPQDNQSPTDTRWISMCDQHRFIILYISLLWTQ